MEFVTPETHKKNKIKIQKNGILIRDSFFCKIFNAVLTPEELTKIITTMIWLNNLKKGLIELIELDIQEI